MKGRRSIFREVAILLAAAVVLAAAAFGGQRLLFSRSPVSGELAKNLDASLGSVVRSQILATHTEVDVPSVNRDFKVITDRLRDALSGERTDFEVIVLQSAEINAFTLPGSTICVDTGLIRQLHSADEMAGVLGHELSHAVNRDPLTLLARRLGVAALLGALSGGQGGTIFANAAEMLVDVHYGREAEDRADAFSVALLARAGIPPAAFGDALERIKKADQKNPGLLKYLDPHSPIDERIAGARKLAARQSSIRRPLGVDWAALVQALPGR